MGIFVLLGLPAVFGLPLACVALIAKLCEWSWEKPAGSMGSTGMFLVACAFCLPMAAYLIWVVIANVIST